MSYQEQIEAGKNIVREMLSTLAKELGKPEIEKLTFKITSKDFDTSQVSIWDEERKTVVLKLNDDDLADCPTTPPTRKKVETQLRTALKSSYGQ